MKAVILAAGKGTRLKELTADRPKPMVETGKRTILEHVISGIHGAGIDEFVVVTGFHANVIEDHFGDGSSFGIRIVYVRQTVQDGTAGALRVAREAVGSQPFLMSFGDIVTAYENYTRLVQEFRERDCAAVMGVNPVDDPWAGAAVYFDDDTRKVERIVEKPPKGTSTSRWNQAGVFVFQPGIYSCIDRIQRSPRGEYEIPDAIRMLIDDGARVQAVPLRGFWGDIGTPEDVDYLSKRLAQNGALLTRGDVQHAE